jgi:tRNA nucleotidyltransferase (CCA-adding enzyme)
MLDLGLARALQRDLDPDPELVASAALGALTIGADRTLTALAAFCLPSGAVAGGLLPTQVRSRPAEDGADGSATSVALPPGMRRWLDDLGLLATQRDPTVGAAETAPWLAAGLRARDRRPSELRALLGGQPPEALALALALRAPADPIVRWATELSRVRLDIDGSDLVAAGIPEGPALGRALDETLDRKLDGAVSGREDELATALELARA